MTVETKTAAKDPQVATYSAKQEAPAPTVQVFEKTGKGKKKKRKYSSGLKDVQGLTRGFVNSSDRLGRAVAKGFSTYRTESDKSARKKRDGAVQYAVQNWAKAVGKSVRMASSAPYKFAKAGNTKTLRRALRFAIQTIAFPLSPFLR